MRSTERLKLYGAMELALSCAIPCSTFDDGFLKEDKDLYELYRSKCLNIVKLGEYGLDLFILA